MPLTNFPNGLSSFGVPVPFSTTGTVYFVDSNTGSDGNKGTSKDKAFATLDYAIGRCTASKGDVIYLMPGHAENIIAADTVDFDVAGVKVVGLGDGALKPTFTATVLAGGMTVAAANVTIENIRLTAGTATTGNTSALNVAAAGDNLTLRGLEFRDTAAETEWLVHISVATTVLDLLIEDCSFVTLAGTMTNSIVFAGTTSNTMIKNCNFYCDASDYVVDHAAGVATNFQALDNEIVNYDAGAGLGIAVKTTSTGHYAGNRCAGAKNDSVVMVGDAMWWTENYVSNTIGSASGVLYPDAGAIP